MPKKLKRDEDISRKAGVDKAIREVFKDVEKGFTDQRSRADDIRDYWDAYNCVLGGRQFYSGNSQIFVPIVKNAIEARKTRFTNTIFPQSGRYVDVTTGEADIPHATMALLEHYVRKSKLRNNVVKPLMTNGDVEGQYSLYVDWKRSTRYVTRRSREPVKSDGMDFPELGEVETLDEDDEVVDAGPDVEVILDADLLVLPATADSIDDALSGGGTVTVVRRWGKAKIRELIKDGDILKEPGETLLKTMARKDASKNPDTRKDLADAAGIKSGQGGKFALVYETWTRLKVEGDMRLVRAYYGGEDQVLGVKFCPYWCDRCPVISVPVSKVTGVFKGRAPVADVIDLQVFANDTVNEGADTAHFSAMPIVMTDPEKNPRTGSMILGLAAVWETNPKDTQFVHFPELWKDAFERVAACKQEIFQTLGINPAMIPQGTGGKAGKRNQAEIANEQQVDILTTADAVTVIEEGVLTPLLERFAEYDHQFRDEEIVVKVFGEMGLRANMETVEPIQLGARFSYRWFGVEAARNAAQVQQQISAFNVLKDIPPQLYQGYKLNAAPLLTQLVENTFGPRLAPLIFIDLKKQLTIPPEQENAMLEQGFALQVHPDDDDPAHLMAHLAAMSAEIGDPHGTFRAHMQAHQQQMQAKAQMQAQMAQQPGGGGGGGGPKPGAQVSGKRQGKAPPGALHPDQMARAGAPGMPRKM